jgi:hypothetical protein
MTVLDGMEFDIIPNGDMVRDEKLKEFSDMILCKS